MRAIDVVLNLPRANVTYVENIRTLNKPLDDVTVAPAGVLGTDARGVRVFIYAHAVTCIEEVKA